MVNEISNIERHILSENQMVGRINLSYNPAITVFHDCIYSNENLFRAYKNYKIYKNESYGIVNLKKDILIHTALDKIAGKLFFTIMNDNLVSHIEFDHHLNTFKNLF